MAKSGPHTPKQPNKPKKGNNFVKNWRIHRKMTVEQLAEEAGLAGSTVSAIENMNQFFSDDSLAKLASALKATPEALLAVDPLSDGTAQFWPLWQRASAEDRKMLTDMAARMVGKK